MYVVKSDFNNISNLCVTKCTGCKSIKNSDSATSWESTLMTHLKSRREQARKPQSYASRNYDRLTDFLTRIECRATIVAKSKNPM